MNGRQKGISGKGHGKWHSLKSLAKYRKARDKANKVQSESRRRNR